MQMATRIRRTWATLADQITASGPTPTGTITALQRWLQANLATVSKKAAAKMVQSRGIALVLERDARTLPVSIEAMRELHEALQEHQPAVDPEALVNLVDALCWRLAVYRREDDSCPMDGDGDLELWTDGHRLIEVCNSFNHMFDESGRPLTPDHSPLRPANVDEVRLRYAAPALAT